MRKVLLVSRSRKIIKEMSNQMRKNLRIGLRTEGVSLGDQLIPEKLKILDHPVVDESQLPTLIQMRVRIIVSHKTMRSPTSVPNSNSTVRGMLLNELRQARNSTCALAELHLPGGKCC